MSFTKEVTIWCDGDDCCCWIRDGNAYSKVSLARKSVQINDGWGYIDGKDLCPRCLKEMKDGSHKGI